MLSIFLFIWIGIQLNAPAWFYVLCGVMFIAEMVRYGKSLYEKGRDSNRLHL